MTKDQIAAIDPDEGRPMEVALIDRGENIVVVGRKLYQEIVGSVYVLHRQVEKLNKEKDTLSDALLDIAEGDCHYGDNCPTFGATRHGTCDACKARYALERAGIPLRSYVEDVP